MSYGMLCFIFPFGHCLLFGLFILSESVVSACWVILFRIKLVCLALLYVNCSKASWCYEYGFWEWLGPKYGVQVVLGELVSCVYGAYNWLIVFLFSIL